MKKLQQIILLSGLLSSATSAGDIVDFGVKTSTPGKALAAQQQLKDDTGYVVTHVFPNTPAATLGIKTNDLVLEVNGKKVRNVITLNDYIACAFEAGEELKVKWQSKGEVKTGSVKLNNSLERTAFVKRYQKAKSTPKNHFPRDPFDSGGFANDDLMKQLDKQMQLFMQPSAGGSSMQSFSFGSSTKSMNDGVHKITVTKKTNGLSHVVISSVKGGAPIFDGDVDSSDLSKVPVGLRKKVKGLLGNGFSIGGGAIDLSDLLKRGGLSPRTHSKNSLDEYLESLDKKAKKPKQTQKKAEGSKDKEEKK